MDVSLAETFRVLTAENGVGYLPFRWQTRLLDRLLRCDLPDAVDVPTGLGKTATMALWLIALAEGAALPRRLIYVVDRRAVVDQATRYAERLRRNLPAEVAEALGVSGSENGLPISTLRGGFAGNREWLEDPSKPAIVVGTIDMIGSRLLFEGYGVSRGMRPYHAGLLGVDALVLLDEAHLCPPFEALLRQVVEHRDGKLGPLGESSPVTPAFRLVSLSATGREISGSVKRRVFRLEEEDREEPIVRARLTASKRLRIHEIEDARTLAERLAAAALGIATEADGRPPRLLVYCHSRKVAVDVKGRIDKECKRREGTGEVPPGWASELLVGERRVRERVDLESWLEEHGLVGGSTPSCGAPVFLIATSAGEVGIDLDADHMVCDLVAWERMVQRLGRVNRRGGDDRVADVVVFGVRPAESKATGGPSTKEGIEACRRHLAALEGLPGCGREWRDASPVATVELKAESPDVVDAATTPAPLYPELTRPLLDAWAMTSLDQHEGRPEVAPWLRGWAENEEPQTEVVWRRYLPRVWDGGTVSAPPGLVTEYFRYAPVHATEKLEAGSRRVLDWLLKRAVQVAKRTENDRLFVREDDIVAVLLDRRCRHAGSVDLAELLHLAAPARGLKPRERRDRDRRKKEWQETVLPGTVLVVDARLCGLRDGMLTERENKEAVSADSDVSWQEEKDDPLADSARPVIGFRVEEVVARDDREGLVVVGPAGKSCLTQTFETERDGGGKPVRGLAVLKWADEAVNEDARSVASQPQLLSEHTEQVVSCVREIAGRVGLPDEEAEALATAARLHDVGKVAPRWQRAMNAPADGQVYAKTNGGGNWRLLEGYRHEFGSLVEAEDKDLPKEMRDLILHLIASHHGRARPILRPNGCGDGPPSQLEVKAGDAALRFARLQRRYGPWGLAWREAILRAADQRASRSTASGDGSAEGG